MEVLYTNFATDRQDAFALKTEIIVSDGEKFVRKSAMNEKAVAHLARMKDNYDSLRKNMSSSIHVCECFWHEDYIDFEYIEGITLAEMIVLAYQQNGLDGAKEKFQQYKFFLETCCQNYVDYEFDLAFRERFGVIDLQGKKCMVPANVDLVLSNIIVRDGVFNVIDYEWVYDFPVPVEYILFRGINIYYGFLDKEHAADAEEIFSSVGIDQEMLQIYMKMEQNFAYGIYDIGNKLDIWNQYLQRNINILDIDTLQSKVTTLEKKISDCEWYMQDYQRRLNDSYQKVEKHQKQAEDYEKRIAEYEFRCTNYHNEVESWKQQYARLEDMPIRGHLKRIAKKILHKK